MTSQRTCLFLLTMLACGCAVSASPKAETANSLVNNSHSTSVVQPVDFQDIALPAPTNAVRTPEFVAPEVRGPIATEPEERGLTLELIKDLAVANHPAIGQAQAQVKALRGKWLQVGLAPNPTVGYLASEINAEGSAGQQGGFAGQEFITAHKLKRNRSIVCAEIQAAEQELATVIRRVKTDASVRYYNALLAQRRVTLAEELAGIAETAVETSQALLDAAEIPLAGLLQSELQLQNATLMLRTSNNRLDQAWRQLQVLLADQNIPLQPLSGEIQDLPGSLDFDAQLSRLQTVSPEMAQAMAEVTRSRRVLNRECVEAIPNVTAQLSVQYDDANSETLTGVQVGVPLPIWNRNQGAICRARAEVTKAVRNIDRVELRLESRLAESYREYADARITAETYDSEILPRAEKTLDLIRRGYAQGEVAYLELLTAQQTFSQTNLAYLDSLQSLWQSYLLIDGLLLDGSLDSELPW